MSVGRTWTGAGRHALAFARLRLRWTYVYIFFEDMRPAGSTCYIQVKRILNRVEPAGPVRATVDILLILFASIKRGYMARPDKQPGALHASAPNVDANGERFTLWSWRRIHAPQPPKNHLKFLFG